MILPSSCLTFLHQFVRHQKEKRERKETTLLYQTQYDRNLKVPHNAKKKRGRVNCFTHNGQPDHPLSLQLPSSFIKNILQLQVEMYRKPLRQRPFRNRLYQQIFFLNCPPSTFSCFDLRCVQGSANDQPLTVKKKKKESTYDFQILQNRREI